MELTTPQIYGFFAMLTAAAIAGLIFYCIGLRTGRQAADELTRKLTQYSNTLGDSLAKLTADLVELKRTLDTREGALSKLRQSLIEEQRDHGEVERGLLNRLAAACPMSDEDCGALIAMAAKLGLAANTFDGLKSPGHARAARLLQAKALDMAERVKTSLDTPAHQREHSSHVITDTDLIEWLNSNAAYDPKPLGFLLEVDMDEGTAPEFPDHLRDLLAVAIQQQQDTLPTAHAIGNFREQEAERAA